MISYSANYEDVIPARVFRGQKSGFYIDVGAHNPIGCNHTLHFYNEGWCGINVEPSSTFSEFPVHRNRDVNLNIAVSDCYRAIFARSVNNEQCENRSIH